MVADRGEPRGETVIVARGEPAAKHRDYARGKLDRLREHAHGPILYARVELTEHADPARQRPALAKAELDVDGQVVRAHATAPTMVEAVDDLEERLRQRLDRAAHRPRDEHLRHRDGGEHEWRHGAYSPPRPSFVPRPAEERAVVRHKSFALTAMTPDEAVADLEILDHDFYLFENVETGEDNVVARSGPAYELFEPDATCSLVEVAAPITHSAVRPARQSIDDARESLDLLGTPFVFFVDPASGRGRVLYRRHDGHYGLIEPATRPPSGPGSEAGP